MELKKKKKKKHQEGPAATPAPPGWDLRVKQTHCMLTKYGQQANREENELIFY